MNIGMMWLDADTHRTLEEKVKQASRYYQDKYGQKPTEAQVNSKTLPEERVIGGLRVVPAKNILLHHIWIGVGDKKVATGV